MKNINIPWPWLGGTLIGLVISYYQPGVAQTVGSAFHSVVERFL